MISPEDIKNLINILPDIVLYLAPGAIFLKVYNFIGSKEDKNINENYFIFKSIILSFVLINIFDFLGKLIKYVVYIGINPLGYKLLIILFSIIFAYLTVKIVCSEKFAKFLSIIGVNRSIHKYILNDIIDSKLGMWVRVYLPDEKIIYVGKIRKYEEKDENFMIILSNYQSFAYGNEKPIENFENDITKWVIVNSKDTSRIELFYEPESSKIN